jgi:diaminopimelate epimerase
MHGSGNDFVIVDGPVELTVARVRELCDRRRGIGADGAPLGVRRGDDAGR